MLINYSLSAVLFMLLVACGGAQDEEVRSAGVDPSADRGASTSAGAQLQTAIRLYVFDCGRVSFQSVSGFGLAETDTLARELAVPCYIIDHPRGQLLWDAGLPSELASKAGWVARGEGVEVYLETSLSHQLEAMELDFDLHSLEYAAFSHIHWDHVGAANDVASGEWLVQRGDYAGVVDAENHPVPAVDLALLEGIKDRPVRVLDGDHDVFGDGRVRLIAAYGHTPGHQVLYVDLADTGPVILSGDLYHFRVSRSRRVVPLFNSNRDQTLAAMARVEREVTETGATFWIQHDLALFETLRKAPEFYQ